MIEHTHQTLTIKLYSGCRGANKSRGLHGSIGWMDDKPVAVEADGFPDCAAGRRRLANRRSTSFDRSPYRPMDKPQDKWPSNMLTNCKYI